MASLIQLPTKALLQLLHDLPINPITHLVSLSHEFKKFFDTNKEIWTSLLKKKNDFAIIERDRNWLKEFRVASFFQRKIHQNSLKINENEPSYTISNKNQYNFAVGSKTYQSESVLYPIPLGNCSVAYFEVEIMSEIQDSLHFIIGGALKNDQSDVGTGRNSFGFGNTGEIWLESVAHPDSNPLDAVKKGDTIGFGINFHKAAIIFTRNGKVLLETTKNFHNFPALNPASSKLLNLRTLHAAITIVQPVELKVNFGSAPFKFDVRDYQIKNTFRLNEVYYEIMREHLLSVPNEETYAGRFMVRNQYKQTRTPENEILQLQYERYVTVCSTMIEGVVSNVEELGPLAWLVFGKFAPNVPQDKQKILQDLEHRMNIVNGIEKLSSAQAKDVKEQYSSLSSESGPEFWHSVYAIMMDEIAALTCDLIGDTKFLSEKAFNVGATYGLFALADWTQRHGQNLVKQMATSYVDERLPGVAREDISIEAMFYLTLRMQIIDTIIIQRMRMSLNDMQKNVIEASVVYGNDVDLIKKFSEKVALVEKIASIPPDQQQIFHNRMAMVNELPILLAHKIQSAINVAKSSTSDYPPWEHPDWHDYFESILYGLYKAGLTMESGDLEILKKAKNFNDKLVDPQIKLDFLRNVDTNAISKELLFTFEALFGVSFKADSNAELKDLVKEFITETIIGLESEITALLKLQKDILHA